MTTSLEIQKPKSRYGHGKKMITPATVFLGFVLYVNIRHDHVMTMVDWTICAMGGIVFFFALGLFIFERNRD